MSVLLYIPPPTPTPTPAVPAEGLLPLYLKAELAELFALRTPRKDALVMAILSRYPDALIRERLSSVSPWLAVTHGRSLRLAQLLFFGDGHRDLSAFILEDLGMVRYETYQVAPEQRLFENREALARLSTGCSEQTFLLFNSPCQSDIAKSTHCFFPVSGRPRIL